MDKPMDGVRNGARRLADPTGVPALPGLNGLLEEAN
jgi:hypothetical protein